MERRTKEIMGGSGGEGGGDASSGASSSLAAELASPRVLLPSSRPSTFSTASSLPPTTVPGQQGEMFTSTLSVFQFLERYFDLMWKQMERKDASGCVVS
jgi:hypothetical protein